MAIYMKPPTSHDEALGIRRYVDPDLMDDEYRQGRHDWGNVVRTMIEPIADHDRNCIVCEYAETQGNLIVVDFED